MEYSKHYLYGSLNSYATKRISGVSWQACVTAGATRLHLSRVVELADIDDWDTVFQGIPEYRAV